MKFNFIFYLLFITSINIYCSSVNDSITSKTQPNDSLITIIGVGDIMLGTNYPSDSYLPPNNDCKPLLDKVYYILQDADITFGNLEGTFLDTGLVVKKCKDPTKCYAFRTPTSYFSCLVEAGFDVFSLANNHSNDFGDAGKKSTIQLIKDADIKYAGFLEQASVIFEKDSVIYGFCAFSPNNGTCDINNIKRAKEIVKNLDTLCDIVIVSFHGGAEGKKYQHVNKETEMFYGENRGNVYKFAHDVIDAGADVVFGHGPHVTRSIEVYNNRFIAYSLGNFCTYGRFNLQNENGIAPIIKLHVTKTGVFEKGEITPIVQLGEGGVSIDDKKQVIYKIKELTEQDFPALNNILINDNGLILNQK